MVRSHFPLSSWTDFVRGVLPPAERNAMQQHLQADCPDCLSAERMYRAMAQFLRAEAACTPPASATRFVVGAMAWARPGKRRLVLAEWLGGPQPIAAGLRSGTAEARHAAFMADDWVVDIRLEPAARLEPALLAGGQISGQILHATDAERVAADAPVSIRRRRRVLQVTSTNMHGEFHLSLPAGAGEESHLAIHISAAANRPAGDAAKTLIIPLRILASRSGAAPSGDPQ